MKGIKLDKSYNYNLFSCEERIDAIGELFSQNIYHIFVSEQWCSRVVYITLDEQDAIEAKEKYGGEIVSRTLADYIKEYKWLINQYREDSRKDQLTIINYEKDNIGMIKEKMHSYVRDIVKKELERTVRTLNEEIDKLR